MAITRTTGVFFALRRRVTTVPQRFNSETRAFFGKTPTLSKQTLHYFIASENKLTDTSKFVFDLGFRFRSRTNLLVSMSVVSEVFSQPVIMVMPFRFYTFNTVMHFLDILSFPFFHPVVYYKIVYAAVRSAVQITPLSCPLGPLLIMSVVFIAACTK